MLSGRPLYDSSADRRYFIVPPEWNTLMRAVDHGNNVLLAGPRGSGKTSLLRQLQMSLRDGGDPVAFIDGGGLDAPLDLATRVLRAVSRRPRPFPDPGGAEAELPPGGTSAALLDLIGAIGRLDRTIVLIDGSGSAAALYEVFGRLRDMLWQTPHQWVVAVDETEHLSVLRPPADAFFDIVVRLQPLSLEKVVELLRRRDLPPQLDQASLLEIAASSGGNPRAALRAANEAVVTERRPGDMLGQRAQLLTAASELGRPHGMLMSELLDLGQASPSDVVLSERLGLSRARITALLRDLLAAGLVDAAADRSVTPGRPKTIYRPRLEGAR